MISLRRRLSLIPVLLLLIAPSLAPLLRAEKAAADAKEEKIDLPKVTVTDDAVCSFGFGVAFSRDRVTLKVKRVFITAVAPDSVAAQRGLQEGDEIIALNGEKVAGMDGEIRQGKQLFALLANQPVGQTIDLDVVVRTTKKITLRATGL